MVIGDRLHDVLRIVEHAGDGDVEDVVVLQRIHLRTLKGAHLAVRREHEHAYTVLATHGVFGSRAGVAGRCAKDVYGFGARLQDILEQIAEQLHRHVLEGQGGAVRQFQQPELAFLEPMHWRDVACLVARTPMAIDLGGIGFIADGSEVIRWNIGDELGQDLEREFGIRQAPPGVEFGARHLRVGLGQIKPTIGRQTT